MKRKSVFSALLLGLAVASPLSADVVKKPDDNTLWLETFKTDEDAKRWREAANLKLSVAADQWVVEVDMSGPARSTGRYVPWESDYPYLQIDLAEVNPLKGYKGWSVMSASSDGGLITGTAGGFAPGLWTLNLRDFFPKMKAKQTFFLRIDMHGGMFRYNSIRMVKRPANGLELSFATAKRELTAGDKVKITAVLEEPALDVTVSLIHGYILRPLKNVGNPEGYIQLTSEDKGKSWTGEVTVAANLDKKPIKAGQLIFCANVLGGKLRKLYSACPYAVNPTGKTEGEKK